MIVDGKLIANDLRIKLKNRVHELGHALSLGIILTQETPATRQFAALKKSFGESIGVSVEFLKLGVFEQNNENLLQLILRSTRTHNGLVVQLPLPLQFSLENVLNILPLSHDVDVLGNTGYQQFKEGNLPFLPPVVGAFAEILSKSSVGLAGKKVLVIGEGRLVGRPAVVWARHLGATVTVATKETADITPLSLDADIIMLGAGSPGLLKPEMVKEGVMILDAGGGEVGGVVQGDADSRCAEKASLFTPTPGGVGPITVAKIFENLLVLYELRNKRRS